MQPAHLTVLGKCSPTPWVNTHTVKMVQPNALHAFFLSFFLFFFFLQAASCKLETQQDLGKQVKNLQSASRRRGDGPGATPASAGEGEVAALPRPGRPCELVLRWTAMSGKAGEARSLFLSSAKLFPDLPGRGPSSQEVFSPSPRSPHV